MDSENHVCTAEKCPPTGGYYVSARNETNYWLMAGPYQTHAEALKDKRRALMIADKHDAKAWWMAWGTCRVNEEKREPGVLNKRGLIAAERELAYA